MVANNMEIQDLWTYESKPGRSVYRPCENFMSHFSAMTFIYSILSPHLTSLLRIHISKKHENLKREMQQVSVVIPHQFMLLDMLLKCVDDILWSRILTVNLLLTSYSHSYKGNLF